MTYTREYGPNDLNKMLSDIGLAALQGHQVALAPAFGHAEGHLKAVAGFTLTVHAPHDPFTGIDAPALGPVA
ncbi:MAG: hypothetical protein ACK5PF_08255 [bacterium]